jgi:hypothetical protein
MSEKELNAIIAVTIFVSYVALCAFSAWVETRYHERRRKGTLRRMKSSGKWEKGDQ